MSRHAYVCMHVYVCMYLYKSVHVFLCRVCISTGTVAVSLSIDRISLESPKLAKAKSGRI